MDRRHLTRERSGHTYEATFHTTEGSGLHVFCTISVDDRGAPREVFLIASKQGTVIRGLLDTVAILISYLLQYGASAKEIEAMIGGMEFDPKGSTADPDIPQATSVIDWVVQRLLMEGLA